MLRAVLLGTACSAWGVKTVRTRYGLKYVLAGGMKSPDGRDAQISIVCFVEGREGRLKFVTAYPSEGEEKL